MWPVSWRTDLLEFNGGLSSGVPPKLKWMTFSGNGTHISPLPGCKTRKDVTRKLHVAATHTQKGRNNCVWSLLSGQAGGYGGRQGVRGALQRGRGAGSHFLKLEAPTKPLWHRRDSICNDRPRRSKGFVTFFNAQPVIWSKAVVILDLFSITSRM